MSEKPEKIWLIWVTKNVRWSEKPDQRFPYDLGYIRSDIVEKMLTEQREMCADAVTYAWNHRNFDQSSYELMLRDACLNANASPN